MNPGQNPYSPPSANLTNHVPYAASSETGITARVVEMLARTKGWVRFIGVLSFIGAAFVALGLVAMLAIAGKAGAVMLPIVVLYGAMVAFYIYAGLKLNGYASAITRLIYSGRVADLEDALDQQRAFWKFAGIMMLLFIILMVLAMAGGAFTAMQSAPFGNF